MMKFMYILLYWLVFPFFNIPHPSKVIGREHIPEGAMLVCANHTTMSDPLFMLYAFPIKFRLRAMAKAELMRVPVVGWFLNKAGVFGVERGKSDVAAIKQAMKCLKDGERLLLFPQGTRVEDGETGSAKTGMGMLALRCNVPIMPVYIEKAKWFRRSKVILGEPYWPEKPEKRATAEDYQRVADDWEKRIQALKEQHNL